MGRIFTTFLATGCSLNIVFFSKILKYIPDFGNSRFFLGVYNGLHARTTKWQVEYQRYSRTGKVKKNDNILKKNTIFNELIVPK